MVKTYLRFELKATHGLVSSPECNAVFDRTGENAVCGNLEAVRVWNLRRGASVCTLFDEAGEQSRSAAVRLVRSPDESGLIAAGYDDGSIRLWDLKSGEARVTFHGHRSAITALAFNADGTRLASGSKDTEIVVWDPLAESGVCRLRGHKDGVTDLSFSLVGSTPILISSSKDTLLKVWDLDQQYCAQTVTGHRGEVCSVCVNAESRRVVTGSTDAQIRVYKLADRVDPSSDVLMYAGSLLRSEKQRVGRVRFSAGGRLLACHTSGRAVELFRQRSAEQIEKKLRRRRKREREKLKKKSAGGAVVASSSVPSEPGEVRATPADEFEPLLALRAAKKVRSLQFHPSNPTRMLLGLATNTLVVYDVDVDKAAAASGGTVTKGDHFDRVAGVRLAGHTGGVRWVALSSDDQMILTTSSKQTKIWNVRSGACVRTLDSGYGLCGAFVPGNRHAVVGTKEGNVELYDLGSATMLAKVKAHDGTLWSLDPRPDRRGFATGGSDKTVKFWEYQVTRSVGGQASVGVVLSREMQMTDEVLCVCHSPNGRWIAVGLLDSTIKVFFEDTLKFYLSLYGHKLPVMCLDISDDSAILASGGADKDLKIWGLDFGDCHKSLFAHDDSVMAVRFVPKTHYVFTAGKDRLIKFWDADKFEHVMTLRAHHAEVWSLALGSEGNMLVSASNDRSIRVWEQTEEMVFADLERRKDLEEKLDQDESAARAGAARGPGAIEGSGLAEPLESAPVATSTNDPGVLMGAERLMEAMEVVLLEEKRQAEYRARVEAVRRKIEQKSSGATKKGGLRALFEAREAPGYASPEDVPKPEPNPVLGRKTVAEYVYAELSGISPAARDDALLALPYKYACLLLAHCRGFMEERLGLETTVKTALFLASVHAEQLTQDAKQMDVLAEVRRLARPAVRRLRDTIGRNVAGLKHMLHVQDMNSNKYFFGEKRSGDGPADPSAVKKRKV